MSETKLPLLLEPEQLVPHLEDADVLVLDMRGAADYSRGHIPGSVPLEYGHIISAKPPVGGLLPSAEQLSTVLSAVGLTPDKQVVAYDEEGGGRAGRLLWTLDALGHRQLSLLNGGWVAWQAAGLPIGRDASVPQPSAYQAAFSHKEVVADKDYILSRLGQPDFQALDCRSAPEYNGQDVRSARGGHIPGAVHFNFIEAIDRSRQLRFLPDGQLRQMLESRGVTPDKEIVVYCQTHHRSSHTYMVLKHLGYPRVRGYHGAWSDWGNDPATPIE